MNIHDIRKKMEGQATPAITVAQRSRRLKSLTTTESMLDGLRKRKLKAMHNLWAEIAEVDERLDEVRTRLKGLRASKGCIVTEHALLRYVERYMDVDLEAAYESVAKLDSSQVVKRGNTVITVVPQNDI